MSHNIEKYIRDIIVAHGPLSLDRFIQISSSYYYSNRNPIGENSDFITSSEISQMFGEMLAIYIVEVWREKLQKQFVLIELGPGNGTMMRDILRTLKNFPEVYNGIAEVALVETSIQLAEKQKNALKKFSNLNTNHYQNIEEVDGDNFFVLANEFLDALPIKQFVLKDGDIYELVVSLDEKNNFRYGLIPNVNRMINVEQFKDNQLIELSRQRDEYSQSIAKKISNNKGYALIIDYGYLIPPNKSTLQSVSQHKKLDVFDSIGKSDITSLVNFNQLKCVFTEFNISTEINTQRDFLLDLGILQRAEILSRASPENEKITRQMQRLIDKKEMGELFKVLKTM
jgi:cyclopropane-fatty-acyl-phospholipid synthase